MNPFSDEQSKSYKIIVILISRLLGVLVGVLFVPLYIKFIGIEGYGLVAFYATLSGSLAIFDLGLSSAISRQVAFLKTKPNKSVEIKNLVYSIECVYWVIGILIGTLIIFLADPISAHWIKSNGIPVTQIRRCVMLMGMIFAFQFPGSIYNGVMIGLEKQVSNAFLNVAFALIKAVGVLCVLKFISSSIVYYFYWQIATMFALTLSLRFLTYRFLSKNSKPVFSFALIKTIWKFAAGILGISLITFFLSQIDKIVVSKISTLDFVGYYNLAFLIAGILSQLIAPMQNVIAPKFTVLLAAGKTEQLIELYHKSCRWVAIIVFPIGITIIFFAHDILFFWTKNPTVADNTTVLLQIVTAGSLCNCLTFIPYFFLLANGITKFTIYQNIIASIVLTPLLFIWTGIYGTVGASLVWLSVNAACLLISIPVFHKLFLKGELAKWVGADNAAPFMISGALIVAAKLIQMYFIREMNLLVFILIISCLCILYSLFISDIRNQLRGLIARFL